MRIENIVSVKAEIAYSHSFQDECKSFKFLNQMISALEGGEYVGALDPVAQAGPTGA
jgi:hypothetical protein